MQNLLPQAYQGSIQYLTPLAISNTGTDTTTGSSNNRVWILCYASIMETSGSGTPTWTDETLLFNVDATIPAGNIATSGTGTSSGTTPPPSISIARLPSGVYFPTTLNINQNAAIAGIGIANAPGTGHALLFFPSELAVDANRDGTIVLASDPNNSANVDSSTNQLPVDTTSQNQPYRFWLNNNQDVQSSSILFGTAPNTVPPKTPDCKSTYIVSTRDLEDWTRLWIKTTGLNAAVESGTIKVGLKWTNVISGTPGIELATASDTDGGLEYLSGTSGAAAATQIGADPNEPADDYYPLWIRTVLKDANNGEQSIVPTNNTADFVFPQWVWTNLIETKPVTHFLFEGSSKGHGQLEIVFLKNDGSTLLSTGGGVWLDIRDVKEMYQRAIASGAGAVPYPSPPTEPYVSNSSTFNDSNLTTGSDTTNPDRFSVPWDETKQCVIFLHGFYTDYNGYLDYSETMFKRLWWQGYKGRFIAYNWPALSGPAVYNSSEWTAWVYGRPFMNYVNSVKGQFDSTTIVAHSQGNVVVGSAIQEGLKFDNYIMLEAALPTGCYTSGTSIDYAPFLRTGVPKPDLASNLGYRNYIGPSMGNVGNYYCFYNPQDFALHSGGYLWGRVIATNWEADQLKYKPDSDPGNQDAGYYYGYSFPALIGYFFSFYDWQLRQVADIHESMSFVARPRSQAAGADPHSPSVFGQGTDLSQPPYNFTDQLSDHSGQVERPYYLVYPLFQQFEQIITP